MAEGKTNSEIILEHQLKILLAEERALKMNVRKISTGDMQFSFGKEDLVKGIILREILGPPKASEG
ncbi:MAG: hypothetical protein J7L77_07300 [Clostridiales bacterium]|nr:hypothetical protein [Clostridiales bacterium]